MENEDCPTPDKMKYAIPLEAHYAAQRAEREFGSLQYMYPCRCGWWHLSRTPRRQGTFHVSEADGSCYVVRNKKNAVHEDSRR